MTQTEEVERLAEDAHLHSLKCAAAKYGHNLRTASNGFLLRTATATFHLMDIEGIARVLARLKRKTNHTTKTIALNAQVLSLASVFNIGGW